MRLLCDNCSEGCRDGRLCQGTVRAFIEPDGPRDYLCECYCAKQKREREEDDRKLQSVVMAYRDRYGGDALRELVAPFICVSEGTPSS
jgi:hypothetical protein